MELSFIIPPLFPEATTALQIDWPFELPLVGDRIGIMYYLDEKEWERLDKDIITDYPGISDLEKSFIGESKGTVLDYYLIKVNTRIWTGRGYGMLLNCELLAE
ncbi:hypothetical protein [Parabacteroides pacaensis]|uniref:hypothetical protein n=1 Tax=Parabacteroides pacaensis TaxID=2086575 RepID=UPI000D112342|nr:hypothetical protein [Parabacteroides pacaensis]